MSVPQLPPRPVQNQNSNNNAYNNNPAQSSAPPVPALPPGFRPEIDGMYDSQPHFMQPLVAPRPQKLMSSVPAEVSANDSLRLIAFWSINDSSQSPVFCWFQSLNLYLVLTCVCLRRWRALLNRNILALPLRLITWRMAIKCPLYRSAINLLEHILRNSREDLQICKAGIKDRPILKVSNTTLVLDCAT
jgi:hypothetical protein